MAPRALTRNARKWPALTSTAPRASRLPLKQISQSYGTGELKLADVAAPARAPSGGILVDTSVSLISAGTERTVVDLARKSLVEKARERPDLVKKVLDKTKREGILAAFEAVRARLDSPFPSRLLARRPRRRRGQERGRLRARRPRGVRGGGPREPLRGQCDPEEPCGSHPRRRERRGGCVRHGRRDRAARASASYGPSSATLWWPRSEAWPPSVRSRFSSSLRRAATSSRIDVERGEG